MISLPESSASFDARLQSAIDALEGGLPMQGSPELPQRVNERLASAAEVANMRSARVDRKALQQVSLLLTQARNAGTRAKRIVWLRRAADKFSAAVAPHAACRKGCAHCCHISLKMTQAEATEIGKAIGVVPAHDAADRPERAVDNEPCPFLIDGACSIYDHRPVVCRSHFNMDADDLLCQLVPGATVPVPFMDNRPIMLGVWLVGGESPRIADVRDWFPTGKGLEKGGVGV